METLLDNPIIPVAASILLNAVALSAAAVTAVKLYDGLKKIIEEAKAKDSDNMIDPEEVIYIMKETKTLLEQLRSEKEPEVD